jgi:VanZ family protein
MSRRDRIELGALGLMVASIFGVALAQGMYPIAFAVWGLCLFGIGLSIPQWRIILRYHLALFFLPFNPMAGTLIWALGNLGIMIAGSNSEAEPPRMPWRHEVAVMLFALPLAYLSGSGGSAGGWTDQLREWFNLTPDQADLAVKIIRKTIHFCAYGTIAMTAYLATRSVKKGRSAIIVALVWGCAHGAFDELRQAQTPGRQGRLEDFMVDLAGMIVFLAVTHWLCNNRDKTAINES